MSGDQGANMSVKGAEGLAGAVLGVGGGLAVCSALHAAEQAGSHIGRVVYNARVAAAVRAQIRNKEAVRQRAVGQWLADYNSKVAKR